MNWTTSEDIQLWEKWAIAWLVSAFVLIGLAYSFANPPHEATDEIRHYRFVRYLVENGSLPVQGEGDCRAQSHHPPLYYALAAIPNWFITTDDDICASPVQNPFWSYRVWEVGQDNKNQFFYDSRADWNADRWAVALARGINVLIGAATVFVTWLIGRRITQQPPTALLAASIVAFNPMFGYMSGAINNDVIAALTSGLVLLVCVEFNRNTFRTLEPETKDLLRWGGLLGLTFGLALLAKFNNVALGGLIAGLLIWSGWHGKRWKEMGIVSGTALAVTLLVAGWWFARNQMIYGEWTGVETLKDLWGERTALESFGLAISELPQLWSSLWGRFGFGQIPLPSGFYLLFNLFMTIGFLGALLDSLVYSRQPRKLVERLLLGGSVLLFFIVVFYYMLISPAGAMGRFLFPALPAMGVLLALGWRFLLRQFPLATVWIQTILFFMTLIALFGYLKPAYAKPAQLSQRANIPNERGVVVAGMGTIIGFDVQPRKVFPGQSIEVTTYWEVDAPTIGNFVQFTHLHDGAGFVTQRDSYTGTGAFPSSMWREGDRFVDKVWLHVPETAYAPNTAEVTIGFYPLEGTYRLQLADKNGSLWGDTMSFGEVEILADRGEIPNQIRSDFGRILTLIGYEYDNRILDPADELTITLYWRTLARIEDPYQIQVLVLDENENYRGSADLTPDMTDWTRTETYTTTHTFPLDQLPAPVESGGSYIVRVAVQSVDTGDKLKLLHPDGAWIGEYLSLSPFGVR